MCQANQNFAVRWRIRRRWTFHHLPPLPDDDVKNVLSKSIRNVVQQCSESVLDANDAGPSAVALLDGQAVTPQIVTKAIPTRGIQNPRFVGARLLSACRHKGHRQQLAWAFSTLCLRNPDGPSPLFVVTVVCLGFCAGPRLWRLHFWLTARRYGSASMPKGTILLRSFASSTRDKRICFGGCSFSRAGILRCCWWTGRRTTQVSCGTIRRALICG